MVVEKIINVIAECLYDGGKVILIGNGGSAADAQHIAAEFTGRYNHERPPLRALAFTNTSELTAIANDYTYDHVFERLVEAWADDGDVLIALSTSGKSENILAAIERGAELGMTTVGFTGRKEMGCDLNVAIGWAHTATVQEEHMRLLHRIVGEVEDALSSLWE